MKLTKTQTAALLFIANCPGKLPARTATRTLNALLTNGMIKRNERMILVPTMDGYNHLRSLGHNVTDRAAIRNAETAAQNLLNVIQDGDYRMTSTRDTARDELLAAIAAAYPNLHPAAVFNTWSEMQGWSIRQAAAYVQTINDEDEEA